MLDSHTGQFQGEQIGSFFSFARATDEFGVSLIGEARIPKRDLRLCETILRMYEAGTLAFSFEIEVACLAEVDGMTVIDAAEGNELIGMAVVSTPAYPEATALMLVAETDEGKDEEVMDEKDKKIAELEAKMMLAEQQSENDEEMRKKEEELEEEKRQREQAEAALASANEQLAQKDARIAELEAKVTELKPFQAEVEQLRADRAAAELAAKQQELTRFAEAQGLDVQAEAVAEAIQKADYAALVAEALRAEKPAAKPVVAAYAMSAGIPAKGEYDDLLSRT